MRLPLFLISCSALLLALFAPIQASAKISPSFEAEPLSAHLITAQNGVSETTKSISAGLSIKLADGWKIYWRSPGEVGVPPQIDLDTSSNVASFEMVWPAPERFTAFGIENFGYSDEVVFPLRIDLETPGQPVNLALDGKLLACSEVCVPLSFELSMSLPLGSGIDAVSAARISRFASFAPIEASRAGITDAWWFIDKAKSKLIVQMEALSAFRTPDIFPELGPGTALGKPDIRIGSNGLLLWAEVPILRVEDEYFRDPVVTVTDGTERSFWIAPEPATQAPKAPYEIQSPSHTLTQFLSILVVAFLGGALLNVMPCVLPVLSIKLSKALSARAQAPASVRRGFLACALGVMTFMWVLALILIAIKAIGGTIGWGIQFQNPSFLAVMFIVVAAFAANTLGFFELALPTGLQTSLSQAGGGDGFAGDFSAGFFAAMLATPCSAPFLGTAITFALTGGSIDVFLIFSFLGMGLATPYFLVAAYPSAVFALPKPGKWMLWLKFFLGVLLVGTAVWLLTILYALVGATMTIAVLAISLGLIFILMSRDMSNLVKASLLLALFSSGVLLPSLATPQSKKIRAGSSEEIRWTTFDPARIAYHVSQGHVVFVDVTAEWCLTCKVNKKLVLEREEVVLALNNQRIVPMIADWTQPNETIARFLASYERFGIPFNAVFGPNAPEGIILSEILSIGEVLNAIDVARLKKKSDYTEANSE